MPTDSLMLIKNMIDTISIQHVDAKILKMK